MGGSRGQRRGARSVRLAAWFLFSWLIFFLLFFCLRCFSSFGVSPLQTKIFVCPFEFRAVLGVLLVKCSFAFFSTITQYNISSFVMVSSLSQPVSVSAVSLSHSTPHTCQIFLFGGYLLYLGADRLMRGKTTWHVVDLLERSLGKLPL